MQNPRVWRFTWPRCVFGAIFLFLAVFGFLYPAYTVVEAIFDPALNGPGVPLLARRLHARLAGPYEKWARQRIVSGAAKQLSIADVSGTEWPLYGSVFYLWAEEALQDAWERDHSLFAVEPRKEAQGAIDAAARLVADPAQAYWVKVYWGNAYLTRQNLFYRMLLISALASHRRLTGSDEFRELLQTQTKSLSEELYTSPSGLLDDYPDQCYPTDVMSAWYAIQRADAVLGMDHSRAISDGLRAFTGKHATDLGLMPYRAVAISGEPVGPARGCANSNGCMLAPALWPEQAAVWYAAHEKHFWQRDWLAAGFREFSHATDSPQWHFDVDSGPVIRGNGFAACAFGVAASRRQGRFDHAYPLSVEMVSLSWPLPVALAIPRLASDSANAPFLGEAAILFQLTAQPILLVTAHHHGALPAIVWFCLVIYLGGGLILLRWAYLCVRPRERTAPIGG
jgi:hypothetical protein